MPGMPSFRMYATSSPDSTDGLNFTPGPAATSDAVPVAMSIETIRVSSGCSGTARRLLSVCSAVMQYVMMRRLSAVHFGLPQKLPCALIRFSPEPSGRTMYTSAIWRCSHRPCANGRLLPRSDENAIHLPSGDHDGRKSPPDPDVSALAARVSRIERPQICGAAVSRRDEDEVSSVRRKC